MLCSTISIGKYGSFQANSILGRPYHLTYEISEPQEKTRSPSLRVVPASELHTELLTGETCVAGGPPDNTHDDGVDYEVDDATGEAVLRSNRETVDDPSRQKLSLEEIEALKRDGTGSGKELISRLVNSHSGITEKTNFSLAKYTLRKARKYMRRFTVLPMDVPMLARWLFEGREPAKIMELREEMLSLMGSWANVHWTEGCDTMTSNGCEVTHGCGRWLVVDDTGGLVVAALAERAGILYASSAEDDPQDVTPSEPQAQAERPPITQGMEDEPAESSQAQQRPTKQQQRHVPAMSAVSNTITVLHANAQPNLSLLKYFHFDASNPSPGHPLFTHLKTLSWLQLLSPEEDAAYTEPEEVPDDVVRRWKSGKRAVYFRKRRRWERVKGVVDEARAGAFDGLVVASPMSPVSVMRHAVPLLRGGAPVVVYSPNIEPLAELADLYSTARRTAFLSDAPDPSSLPSEDFPLNPTLVLAPTIQTARIQNWQCLPGRTHPLMTSRGGAEGYLFTAIRVLPAEGKVEARGKFKKRKVAKHEKTVGEGGEQASVAADVSRQEDTTGDDGRGKDVGDGSAEAPSVPAQS